MKSRLMHILMAPLTIFCCFSLMTITQTVAQEIVIVDVKRNITLADSDPIYKDFYLNAGDGTSLRKNMVVTVKRKMNIRDSASKSVGEFDTVVGQLKIIHIGNKVSVAREHKLQSRESEPMLEQIGIMTGDKIDLAGAYIDNKPAPKPTGAQAGLISEPAVSSSENSPTETEKRNPAAAAEAPAMNKSIPIPQL